MILNNKITILGVACALFSLSSYGQSFNYDDCVLQGLKGVSSDAAARMVKEACNNKRLESYRQADKKINDEYGEEDSSSVLEETTKFYSTESGGNISKEYRNASKDSNKMVSYVKISVRGVDKSGYCDFATSKSYAYKTSIKQNSTVSLIFPKATESLCIDVISVRTKPYKWSDFSISSSVKPLENDPFATKSVGFFPAAPAPAPAAAPAPYYPPIKR